MISDIMKKLFRELYDTEVFLNGLRTIKKLQFIFFMKKYNIYANYTLC